MRSLGKGGPNINGGCAGNPASRVKSGQFTLLLVEEPSSRSHRIYVLGKDEHYSRADLCQVNKQVYGGSNTWTVSLDKPPSSPE
nr:hypothetical transcript [Hymenolepis microstoma]CUU98481.1 hypothetical transcript [Hymenolepis microstoma]